MQEGTRVNVSAVPEQEKLGEPPAVGDSEGDPVIRRDVKDMQRQEEGD